MVGPTAAAAQANAVAATAGNPAAGITLEQIERDDRLLFSIKHLWWLARYAY